MEDTEWERLGENKMSKHLGCDVDWSKAPEGAVFYAEGYFRDNLSNSWCEYDGKWMRSLFTQERLLQASDYEHRPDKFKAREYYQLQNATSVESPSGAIKSEWTASHYDNYYHLTPKDIEAGRIKIDAYFVNKMWKLNQKDDTGGLFHNLKTIARFSEKNSIERELKALYNQTKRMAELYGVDLA